MRHQQGKTRGTIFIFVILLMFLSLAFSSFAKSSGAAKTAKQITGYCVYHGRILKATETNCKKQHGRFFKDKKAALAYLDAQTPGYCCLNNEVFQSKKGDCLKKKGHFFKEKKMASGYCDYHQAGYCCLDGRVVSKEKGDCLKKKGRFFKEKKMALTYCDLHQKGWCCKNGKISAGEKNLCLKGKGKFFKEKRKAVAFCSSFSKKSISKKTKTGTSSHTQKRLPGKSPVPKHGSPAARSDARILDFTLSNLCVHADGHLIVRIHITDRTHYSGSTRPSEYTLPFTVRHEGRSAHITHTIPASPGGHWVYLGDIDRFTTEEERRNAKEYTFTVTVNHPSVVTETNSRNNSTSGRIRVRRYDLRLTYDHAYYSKVRNALEPFRTDFGLSFHNDGYARAFGGYTVRQIIARGGGTPRYLDLGTRRGLLVPSYDESGGTLTTRVFEGGISRPRWENSTIEITFTGVLAQLSPLSVPFNLHGNRSPVGRRAAPTFKKGPSKAGGTKGGGTSLDSSMTVSGGGFSERAWAFPARITRVSEPVYPGRSITIRGNDFGSRRGQVKLNVPTSAALLTCEVTDWSETEVRAIIPQQLANTLHAVSRAAILVWPAYVPDRPAPPSDTEGEEALEEYQGYHYNGHEGPSCSIRIEPLAPVITSFSNTEISEGDHLEINGHNFGHSGTLTLLNGSRRMAFTLDSWSDTHIRVTIPFNALESFGNPERATVSARIENEYHNETTADNTFTIRRVDNYDLCLVGIRVSNYGVDRILGQEKPHFDMVPIIKNNGPDRCTATIIIGTYSDVLGSRDRWEYRITSPLAAGSEREASSSHRIRLSLSHGIYVQIEGLLDGPHNDNLDNNACHFNVTHNGVYMCEARMPSGR